MLLAFRQQRRLAFGFGEKRREGVYQQTKSAVAKVLNSGKNENRMIKSAD